MESGISADAVELVRLRDQAAGWLTARGIRQWSPGEVTLVEVSAQLARGEWHVCRGPDGVVAALRFLLSDEPVWGEREPDSAYVHGLMVDRSHSGAGLGEAMLEWAAERARNSGLRHLRLDCVQGNPDLLAYYLRAGFVEVGRRRFDGDWLPAVLLQRDVL